MGANLTSSPRSGSHRRRRSAYNAEINITPLVDVMLVLLIVFMVTAPLLTAGVEIDLPKAKARALATEQEPLSITIKANGEVYLQETLVTTRELVPKATAIVDGGYDRSIYVRADAKADWEQVISVVAMLNTAGFKKIRFVTAGVADTADTAAGGG